MRLILTATLALVLSACGGGGGDPPVTAAPQATCTPVVGVVNVAVRLRGHGATQHSQRLPTGMRVPSEQQTRCSARLAPTTAASL